MTNINEFDNKIWEIPVNCITLGGKNMEYLIIPDLKIAMGMEDIEDIEDSEEDAIDNILNEDNFIEDDILDVEVNKLKVKDFAAFSNLYKLIQSVAGMESDKMLLYWLRSRNIEYTVTSEKKECQDFCIIDLEA